PVLGAALRIPPLTCVASSVGGPGDTFGSLSAYYRLSYDALGFAARLVPGLYPPGTALTVDSEERDAQAGVGTGNAGVELTRAAAAAEALEYAQALGFGSFSTVNPAPQGDPDGPLPPKADNPYVGVGTPIQLHLRWLDVFGNQIVSALEAPPAGYTGPLDDPP